MDHYLKELKTALSQCPENSSPSELLYSYYTELCPIENEAIWALNQELTRQLGDIT